MWLFIYAALPVRATQPLERLMATRNVDPELTAVKVVNLSTGETVDAHNSAQPLIPASILKTVTIASLINRSGCSYRYTTRVEATGPIRSGILHGDLRIVGSGDPSINAGCEPAGPDFIGEIMEMLRRHGITAIEGTVTVDASLFTQPAIPPTWASADTRQKYGTGCHGFNFRHNARGSSALPDPAADFIQALRQRLKESGITAGNASKSEGKATLLGQHTSASIDEIMRSCMMRSDNLFAEALLRTLPVVEGKAGDTAEAAGMELEYWRKAGCPTAGVTIVDGSGLSRTNRVTADFISAVLTHMAPDPDYASFLPLAGQEGTLKNFLHETPLDSYIALKTGSMSGIQCYAGYKLDDDFAPTHAVVVILNALPRGRTAARAAVEQYLLDLFADD